MACVLGMAGILDHEQGILLQNVFSYYRMCSLTYQEYWITNKGAELPFPEYKYEVVDEYMIICLEYGPFVSE